VTLDQLRLPREEITRTARARVSEGYKRRMRHADFLVTLSWVSVAIVIALFLAAGTFDFKTLTSATTSAGMLAGLIGTDLVLVMLVLAARVPVIDRTFGHDKAMQAHRRIAKPAFYLILAHAVLLLIGYGMSTGLNPIAEIPAMWTLSSWMPFAFIGVGLLIVVVVTSFVAVRRKFPYEVWHVIHLLSYFAVLAAAPHQLSVSLLFTNGSPQRVYWFALYVIVALLLATYRFAVPVVRSVRHGLRVSRVVDVAPGVVSIEMSGRRLRELQATGGQFFVWRFWSGNTWWHAHPLSLSAAPTASTVRITVRVLGAGSAALAKVRPGTGVSIEGPYGIFTPMARTSPRAVFVAAGIGITPIRAMLEHSDLAPGEATVIVRNTGAQDPYLWQELRELCASKGAPVFLIDGPRPRTTPSWQSADAVGRGYTIASYVPKLFGADLYVCGPGPWADLVIKDALQHGVKQHQVHVERFDW
jgi:predicted ferric reductase